MGLRRTTFEGAMNLIWVNGTFASTTINFSLRAGAVALIRHSVGKCRAGPLMAPPTFFFTTAASPTCEPAASRHGPQIRFMA